MDNLSSDAVWISNFSLALVSSALLGFLLYFLMRRQKKPSPNIVTSPEENALKQKLARQKFSEDHTRKAASYKERILDPRLEAKKQKKEEDFYRHTQLSKFRGKGHILGTEGADKPESSGAGTQGSRDAVSARKNLENHSVSSSAADHQDSTKLPDGSKVSSSKKVIQLPEEPPDGASAAVRVTLRTPQGRFYVRRFLKSNHVQVLLDYMTTVGYHQSIYTLLTSYPRHSIHDVKEKTLEEMGMVGGVVLNVDYLE